jgi:polyhydroxybutyrate depolymerase
MAFVGHPPRVWRAAGFQAGAERRGRAPLGVPRSSCARVAARVVAAVTVLLILGCDGGEQFSVVSHGVERRVIVDRPAKQGGERRPLLVILHAAMFSGALARSELDLQDMARRGGVVLAFPNAEGLVWNDGSLSQALSRPLSAVDDDLTFLDALIAALVADGIADPAAIHLVGISSGGMMALRYACSRADRVASVAVFLASMPLEADQDCHPARPLNVLMVAGTADPVVRWTGEVALGGIVGLQQRMSVPASFDFWRRANRCTGLAPARPLPRRGYRTQPDVLVHAATGCAGSVRTLLYEVRGGGHRLVAGDDWTLLRLLGRASPDIDPGALLLEFALKPSLIPGLGQEDSPAAARDAAGAAP